MAKNKVLILEDREEMLLSLREMLPGGKFVVVEARDGKTALNAIKKEIANLRLLVIKFNLPQISGWQILNKAQNHPKLQNIPMVLMAEATDPIQGKLPPADRFEVILYPFDRKQFQKAIKTAIAKAKRPRVDTSTPPPPPPANIPAPPPPPPPPAKIPAPPPPPPKVADIPAPPPSSMPKRLTSPKAPEVAKAKPDIVVPAPPSPSPELERRSPVSQPEIPSPDLGNDNLVEEDDAIINPFIVPDNWEELAESSVATTGDPNAIDPFAPLPEDTPVEPREIDPNNPFLVSPDTPIPSQSSSPDPLNPFTSVTSPPKTSRSPQPLKTEAEISAFEEIPALGETEELEEMPVLGETEELEEMPALGETEALETPIEAPDITPEVLEVSEDNIDNYAAIPYEQFECLHINTEVQYRGIKGLAIAADGVTLVTCGTDVYMNRWNLYNLSKEAQFSLYSKGAHCLTITPDGAIVLTGAEKGNIKCWDINTGELISTFSEGSLGINGLAIAPDGATVVSSSPKSNLKLWDYPSGALLGPLNDESLGATAVTITADGATVLSSSHDSNIKYWDLATGELLGPLNIQSFGVTSLVATPDGQVVISGDERGTIAITSLQTGETIRSIKAHDLAVNSLAISPDGWYLVSVSDEEMKLWGLPQSF